MATDRLEKRMNEAKKNNNKINQVTTYWKVLSNPQMQNFVIKKKYEWHRKWRDDDDGTMI